MKKNYYELSKSEVEKYRQEFSKIINKEKNKDITMNLMIFISCMCCLISILFLFIEVINNLSLKTIFDGFICLILSFAFFTSALYIADLRFKRWIKIKYNIEY